MAPPSSHHAVWILKQRQNDLDRPWGRGDAGARLLTKAQSELKLRPGFFGVAPLSQLVEPGRIVLRSAQLVRFDRIVEYAYGAVRPGQAPLRRREAGSLVLAAQRQDTAFSFDHDIAGIGCRLRDQGDPAGALRTRAQGCPALDTRAHPFGAGARLAEPTSGENQPGRPVSLRRQLLFTGPETPVGK